MTPFEDSPKGEIKERSNGRSELSGIENEPLICAHLNHDKKGPHYSDPENGLRVTKFEECAYHQMHLTCPDKIGMEDMQNRSTVTSYMKQFFNKGFDLEEVREKVGGAIELWEKFLGEKPIIPEVIIEEKYVFKDDSYTPPQYRKKYHTPGGW